MRFKPVIILAAFFTSCSYYHDLMVGNDYSSGIRVQSYYTGCCGRCAKRMIYDDFRGKMHVWFLPIDFKHSFFSMKPYKMIVHYKNRRIIRIEEYKPVYDTSRLRLYIEKRNVSNWIDTNINFENNYLPLDYIDSLLVFNMSKSFPDSYGNLDYISAIKGYCYVRDVAKSKGSHRKTNYKRLKHFSPEDF